MGPSDDADFEAIIVPASAKFGGGALLLLGVLTLLLCLQTVLVVARYDSLMVPIIPVMFALSIGWARRADHARERLRAQGLDSGL